MGRVLLVEDDPDQLELRKAVLELAGHTVDTAASRQEAALRIAADAPKLMIMDLRLPKTEDGLALIREARGASGEMRILVMSGWSADIESRPERALVDRVLPKPVRSQELIRTVAKLALWLLILVLPAAVRAADPSQAEWPFQLDAPAEVVAELDLSSPGADWGRPGREATVAMVRVDGGAPQHVMVYAGAARYKYAVFLGELAAGAHQVRIERNPDWSARGIPLQIHHVSYRQYKPSDPDYPVFAHAPVLFARPNTIGKFTDVPLLLYCERLGDGSLRYSVIFSNEDGGTSTRALMATWGRVTDIEHIYQVWPGKNGESPRALIQTREHKDVPFLGKREGMHPLLGVVTDNNMVAAEATSPVRYQLAPVIAELGAASREKVMDEHPMTYHVSSLELEREGKLRMYGTVDGTKISAPENYLRLELRLQNTNSRLAVLVRLQGEAYFRSSNIGFAEMAIPRSGWVRAGIELPPATQPAQVEEIAFQCLGDPAQPTAPGTCRVDAIGKIFFLNARHIPDSNFWRQRPQDRFPLTIAVGQMRMLPLR